MEPDWGTVIAVGMTVRAAGNRITEPLNQVRYSYRSVAFFGSTIGNQATHCILTWSLANDVKQANQVLNPTNCEQE